MILIRSWRHHHVTRHGEDIAQLRGDVIIRHSQCRKFDEGWNKRHPENVLNYIVLKIENIFSLDVYLILKPVHPKFSVLDKIFYTYDKKFTLKHYSMNLTHPNYVLMLTSMTLQVLDKHVHYWTGSTYYLSKILYNISDYFCNTS